MWENSTAFVAHFPDAEQYSNVLRDLASRLRDAKFAVQTNETSLLITAPDVLYYEEAERQQLMKPLKNSGILDEFTVNDKESFVDWNEENFFVPAELAHMLHELLDNVTPDNTFIKELEKSLSRKVCASVYRKKQIFLIFPCRSNMRNMSPYFKYSLALESWKSFN